MARKNNSRGNLGKALGLAGAMVLGGCVENKEYEGDFKGYEVIALAQKNNDETGYRELRIKDRMNADTYIYATDFTDRDGLWDDVKFRGKIQGHPFEDFSVSDLEKAWYTVVPSERF